MDNDKSPSSKRVRKDSTKNPPQVSQPPPPSQFHRQEPLQPKPPRGPKITYTPPSPEIINIHPDDFKPLVQQLTGLPSTSGTLSSLSTSAPKDSHKITKNPPQVSQPPPPSQFRPQEPLQPQPPRGPVITLTSSRPVVQRPTGLQSQSSALRRYHPQTSAATSSSLSTSAPSQLFDATERAKTLNELGFMGGVQTSMDQPYYHHQNRGPPSFFQDGNLSSSGAISQSLMFPDLSLALRPSNPQGSSSFGEFNPLLQPLTGQISTSSTQSSSSSSTLASKETSDTVHASQRRQLEENMKRLFKLWNMDQPTINYEEVVQNLVQSARQLPQNQPTMDQDNHDDHQNRGVKRSRPNLGNDLSLGGIYQSSMSPGSSSMVNPSDPPQGSSSSPNKSNSNPKD